MAAPISPLTVFVMSLPESLTAREIVEKAKEAGFITTPNAVSQTRARAKEREAKAAKKSAPKKTVAAPPKAAPENAKPPTVPPPAPEKKTNTVPPPKADSAPAAISKSDFVRGQPVDLPGPEVVAKAKAAGIKLSTSLVYEVRRLMRSKEPAKKAAPSKQLASQPAPKPAAKETVAKKPTPRKPAVKKPAAPSAVKAVTSPASAENLLRSVASEIGLGRAISLLEEQREQVLRVLGA
jgi:hypothetical protein